MRGLIPQKSHEKSRESLKKHLSLHDRKLSTHEKPWSLELQRSDSRAAEKGGMLVSELNHSEKEVGGLVL